MLSNRTITPLLTAVTVFGLSLAACTAQSTPEAPTQQPLVETTKPEVQEMDTFATASATSEPLQSQNPSPEVVPAEPQATQTLPTATQTPAPTATAEAKRAALQDFGQAPEIDTAIWLNTDQPLRLADLQGQVVLIDFWTYG